MAESRVSADVQAEIDRRMAEQYPPSTWLAVRQLLVEVLRQVEPGWLEDNFGTNNSPDYVATSFMGWIREEAFKEGGAKLRVLSALAEERSGWPGSTEMLRMGADVLRDMALAPPPGGPHEAADYESPQPGPLQLTWTGLVTTDHTDASSVVSCTTKDGRKAELHLDEEHAEALGGQLVEPPEADWWGDEAGAPEDETVREQAAP